MKKVLNVVVLIAGFFGSIAAEGLVHKVEDAFSSSDRKAPMVVVVDVSEVMNRSGEVKQMIEALQREVEKRSKKVSTLTQEYASKKKELTDAAKDLSEAAREKRAMDLYKLENEIKIEQAAVEKYANREGQAAEKKALEKIQSAVDAIAKEVHADIVLSVGVVHVSDRYNMTARVIERLNKDFKASQAKKDAPKSGVSK